MAAVYERDGVWIPVPKPAALRLVIRGALLNALAYTDGHQGEAGALLGLSARAMSYAVNTYGISGNDGRRPRARGRRVNRPRTGITARPAIVGWRPAAARARVS